jgi:hypothetical protein
MRIKMAPVNPMGVSGGSEHTTGFGTESADIAPEIVQHSHREKNTLVGLAGVFSDGLVIGFAGVFCGGVSVMIGIVHSNILSVIVCQHITEKLSGDSAQVPGLTVFLFHKINPPQ